MRLDAALDPAPALPPAEPAPPLSLTNAVVPDTVAAPPVPPAPPALVVAVVPFTPPPALSDAEPDENVDAEPLVSEAPAVPTTLE